MPTGPTHLDALLVTYVLALAIIDWHSHRIPNLLSAAAAVAGLILQVWLHGGSGFLIALAGAATGFGLFLPFYLLRAFGAGDVKAMATVGIFLGFEGTLWAACLTLIAGGVIGALVLCLTPAYASAALYRLIGLIFAPAATIKRPRFDSSPHPRLRFPYGTAIATGTVAAMFF